MISKRTRMSSLVVVMGGFILMGFQNCAPADSASIGGDGEVRIVDRWAQSKVQFMAESYLVDPNVDSVNIKGFCEESENSVQWEAVRSATDGELVLGEGQVDCVNGSFNVDVAVTQQQLGSCADSMELRASVSNEEDQTQLRLACL